MKTNVVLLFGGRSTEHEVSVRSAKSIYDSLDKTKYNVIPVGITKSGVWVSGPEIVRSLESHSPIVELPNKMLMLPDPTEKNLKSLRTGGGEVLISDAEAVNVVFPVLHGRYGEDGTIQGLFEMANAAYVGCGVMASALGMDKIKQKELFDYHGIATPRFHAFNRRRWLTEKQRVEGELESFFGGKYPLFVKPANTGSSVGISKAKNRAELNRAVDFAFDFDSRVIVEEGIENVREIEVSVLGNMEVEASGCGEIIPANEFYDYDAKYINEDTRLEIPAKLDEKTVETVREMAKRAYTVLEGRGLSRVDFFVTREAAPKVYINEINTLPGFTSVSMYPKLWEQAGVSYSQLVEKLIGLAVEEWTEKQRLKTSLD